MLELQKYFTPPIVYNESCKQVDPIISTDLELIKCLEPASPSIYNHLMRPSNSLGANVSSFLPLHYTTDIGFLKDTQRILKSDLTTSQENIICFAKENVEYDKVVEMYTNIKNDNGFKERYCFMDWEHLVFLNKQDWAMQSISLYNLASPLLTILFPLFLTIIPFFVIKAKGLNISVETYLTEFKKVISNHAIGKVFTQFNEVNAQQKAYLLMSAAFYCFSIYQNALVCARLYNNMYKIYDFLNSFRGYLSGTINRMNHFLNTFSNASSYALFNKTVQTKMNYLMSFYNRLSSIVGIEQFSLSLNSLKQIGAVMTTFYEFHENVELHSAVMYSFGFHGYLDVIKGIQRNLDDSHFSFCSFVFPRAKEETDGDDLNKKKKGKDKKGKKTKQNKTVFQDIYYPALIGQSSVKNTYKLSNNMIITGPNASGKTTILKSTLINILFSQQFGCGCYSSATIQPYSHIHCYLNIPDTSGRDSLLQAEARRCKQIIDAVKETPTNESHLCVFDEIYSGTNPEEAVQSAFAVMKYLANKPNVSIMLTTHYVELCQKMKDHPNMVNNRMKVTLLKEETGAVVSKFVQDFKYTYLLEKGVSKVKGGVKVLIDMKYPEEILSDM